MLNKDFEDLNTENRVSKKEIAKLEYRTQTTKQAIALSEQKFQELKSRATMEETHIRRSYLIDRVIDAEFDKISKKRKRGWKTHANNEALVMYLSQFDEEKIT